MRSLFDMLDRSSEGTVVVDRDARIVWMNQHYAARFGFSDPQDAIGKDCEEVIPNSLLREVITSGEPILLDIMETGRDPLVVTRLPISDLQGNVIGAVGFALFDELKALTPLFSHYTRLQAELIATRQSLAQAQARRAKYNFSSFVGNSPASLEVKRLARRAAPLDAPVLLLGETGTGKELLAHAIHGASGRADKPLVTVNVAAIPDTLLEVEFFGAAAGAYTGADRKGRVGKFELAHGGTLFLDEIGDLQLPLQGKLLRALQEKEFEPLGSNRVVHADVRIIAATSMDLPAMVAQGRFRADLYYRLNVLTIPVPALRERLSDIEALSYSILDKLCTQHHLGHLELGDEALRLLKAHAWPGNVRELNNTLERTVMFADGPRIDARALARCLGDGRASSIALAPTAPAGGALRYDEAMRTFERQLLQDALDAAQGQVSVAAQALGIGRATLYRKLAALQIATQPAA
ncbi:sigma 54-interacting transcriptional regulator [Achromobacter sp. Marseille-Q0513]|uniref:sigma-54 interaction domain-containing protein n=1 Tax=Achromobacter sp. Marseille-Q0513 TaxID=2829161 RepID=UPI002011DFF8|nr:sigma 54-interacting transcriptional regulator [Achromobacter sp. Marseille-Q0513]